MEYNLYGFVFLNQPSFSISYSSWFDDNLKLKLIGSELKLLPIRYGNFGLLNPSNGPELLFTFSIVAKYAYIPFG